MLYNMAERGSHTPSTIPVNIHLRRWAALVLMESYLAWFSLCIYPFVMAEQDIHQLAMASPRDTWLAKRHPLLLGASRVLVATSLRMFALHATLILGGLVLQWSWMKWTRRNRYWALYAWHLPSVAMFYAHIGVVLLLALRLVWDSKLPRDRRQQRTQSWQKETLWPSDWPLFSQNTPAWPFVEWNTEWIIRNMIGGMSAGVALAGTCPIR